MAKSAVSAEQLELILNNVLSKTLPEIMFKTLEKFEDQIDKLIARVEARFDEKMEKVYGDLFTANARIDALEAKLTQQAAGPVQPQASNIAATDVAGIIELTSQALIAMEKEKEEMKMRSRNVILTGISSSSTVSDKELFETFCESHLTVKPRVVHTRRIGKDKAKLCVTLESTEAVDDILDSSSLLRNSADQSVRGIYFNRDLTKRQAQEAYNKRCLAREKRQSSSMATASALNPHASTFRTDDN
jgi:hypothetical protein